MPEPITVERLKQLGACKVKPFLEIFGEEAPLTVEAAVENAERFDWAWAAEKLLPRHLWDEYQRQVEPLRAEYDRQDDALWAEYRRQFARTFAELYLQT